LPDFTSILRSVADALRDIPEIDSKIVGGSDDDLIPVLELSVRGSAFEIDRQLKAGSPAVYVNEARLHQGVLVLNPMALDECKLQPLIERLRALS
jgi:hypothetical protein